MNNILSACLLMLFALTVKAQSPLVLRSKISPTSVSIMTIERNASNDVIISIDTAAIDTGDKSSIYFFGNATYSNSTHILTIPNDGRKYWAISFDPTNNPPVQYTVNGGYSGDCTCLPVSCHQNVCNEFADPFRNNKIVCMGMCYGPDIDIPCPSSCSFMATKVYIDAESVYLNEVHYCLE